MNPGWVILFDWDGTLVDTLEIKIHNAGDLFAEAFGVSSGMVEAVYRGNSGLPRRQVFDAIVRECQLPKLTEESYQALSMDFTERNQSAFSKGDVKQLVPRDTTLALEALTRQGYPLFISSSVEPQELRRVAGMFGLDRYFRAILGSQPGFNKGKDHVNFVLDTCNASLSQIVFIGDEPTDIRLGKDAGVRTVAKTGTYPASRLSDEGPDTVIDNLNDFLPWLDRAGSSEE